MLKWHNELHKELLNLGFSNVVIERKGGKHFKCFTEFKGISLRTALASSPRCTDYARKNSIKQLQRQYELRTNSKI